MKSLKRLATSTYKNIQTKCGTITYASTGEEVYIISYSGHDTELTIPESIENLPVTAVAKKAFLSNKIIRKIILPSTISEIGDFAFARCSKLNSIGIPYKSVSIGHGILMECGKLERIFDTLSEKDDDVAYLLAATMGILDAFYLFDLPNAGSDDWLLKWDSRMKMKMGMDDSEGFSKMLLCGEEDYGSNETNPEYYKHLRRMEKIRVAMLRLMHNDGLPKEDEDLLNKYLLMHIKGAKYEETWQVILDEHGDEKTYYDFLIKIGGVTNDNYEAMLNDMGDSHTEMKAYLLSYIDSMNSSKDAFAEFEL